MTASTTWVPRQVLAGANRPVTLPPAESMTAPDSPAPRPLAAAPPYRWSGLPSGQRWAILGGWAILGLVETLRAVQQPGAAGGEGIPWDYALVGNLPWWLVWGLLTPAIFDVADRFRLDRAGWWRRLPIHLMAGAVFIILHLPAALVLWYYTNPLPQIRLLGFGHAVAQAGRGYLLLEVLAYGAALGLFYAIDNHRRLHYRELDAARLTARAASLETQAVAARLDALRMEMNPHFLFNALNTVSGLVREREHDTAVTVLSRLGDLLRGTLDQAHTQTVPLEQELANLRLYLDIERERFRDRLQVQLAVPESTFGFAVPAFSLQPLVENAVRHGIARTPGPGLIRVTGRLDAESRTLILSVEDSGPGFPRERPPGGIGLANVRARLTQLYGAEGWLTIEGLEPAGSRVSLHIPAAP